MRFRISTFARGAGLVALLVSSVGFSAENGPTPYPPGSDEARWPGVGPIRVFKWMPERRAEFWQHRAEDRGAVVFAGDSLTQFWWGLAPAFPNLKVANRGIGGDTSRGLLFRFREDVLELEPRAIVLCIGTNDLSAHAAPADTAANLVTLIAAARASNRDLPLVLCTVPPRDAPEYPTRPGAQDELNRRIVDLARGLPHVVVLDLYTGLLLPGGGFDAHYYGKDRLHLAPAGYARWAELLRPVLEQLGVK